MTEQEAKTEILNYHRMVERLGFDMSCCYDDADVRRLIENQVEILREEIAELKKEEVSYSGLKMRYAGVLKLLCDASVHVDEDLRGSMEIALEDAAEKGHFKWRRVLNRLEIEIDSTSNVQGSTAKCPRCEDRSRQGLSDTCPSCDIVSV